MSALYARAASSLLYACLTAQLPAAHVVALWLLQTPNTPLPFLVLVALCWEPWAYKARLDWRVWQQGIGSLPQLLQSMPPERAWDSWWLPALLHACLRRMLSLVSRICVVSQT